MTDNEIKKLSIQDSISNENLMSSQNSSLIDFEVENIAPDYFVDEMDERSVLINIVEPEQYLSTKEMIDSIKAGESAIDVIGIVESEPQNSEVLKKNGQRSAVLNFILQCQDGIRLPVVIWEEDIQRLKPFVMADYIIHIDAPYARPQKPSKYTNGRDFVLTCRSNTIINNLGRRKNIQIFNEIDECIKVFFEEENTIIGLIAYMKTEFRAENSSCTKMIGAVTDLKTKLIVHVFDYKEDLEFKKGVYVKIIGKIIEENNKFYLEVKSLKDITKLDGGKNVSEKELSSIVITPKRIFNKENEDVNIKKRRFS